MTDWTTLLRRTEDPKLEWFEEFLDNLGVPHRRNGHTFHAPRLEVPEDDEMYNAAWGALSKTLAEISDDETQDRTCLIIRESLGEDYLADLLEKYAPDTTLDDIPDDESGWASEAW
jgi:hypothetical protein